jgi:hypothetical protein
MTERKFTPFEDNGIQEYVTRDGREAKVCVATCYSSSDRQLLLKGFVRNLDGVWVGCGWEVDGLSNTTKNLDIFDVPVKHTRWVNVYPLGDDYSITTSFLTKEGADRYGALHRVACIEITFEEGEGL